MPAPGLVTAPVTVVLPEPRTVKSPLPLARFAEMPPAMVSREELSLVMAVVAAAAVDKLRFALINWLLATPEFNVIPPAVPSVSV